MCPDMVKKFDPQTYADSKGTRMGPKQAANGIRNLIGLLFVPRYFSEKSTTFPNRRRSRYLEFIRKINDLHEGMRYLNKS